MADKKVEVKISANDTNLKETLSRAGNQLKTFGSSGGSTFSQLKIGIDKATASMGLFGTAIAALSSGLVLKKLFSLHDFMPIDEALLRMQVNFNATAREMTKFKQELSAIAGAAGVDMTVLFTQASKLSQSFKPDDIVKIVKASAMAADAMGTELDAVTPRVVQLMKLYRKTPEEAKAIAESIVASRTDLEGMDRLLQRGALSGGIGNDYKDMLALLGGITKIGFNDPRVMTALQGGVANLFQNIEKLKGAGIDIFKTDPATGQKVKKNAVELLESLDKVFKTKFKNISPEKMSKHLDEAFGGGTGEAVFMLLKHMDKLKEAQAEQGRAAQIASRLAAAGEESWANQLKKVKGHLDEIKVDMAWIYDLAKKPIKWFADSPTAVKGAGYVAGGASAGILGVAVYSAIKSIFSIAGGKGLPVYVTNAEKGGGGPSIPGGGFKWLTGLGAGAANLGIATLPVTIPLAALALSRAQQEASKGLVKWRTDNPDDYAKSQEIMGGKKMGNNVSVTVNIDKAGWRVATNADDMNTKVDVNRGNFYGFDDGS